MRDYDPTTGRYLQADPLGLVDGASVYGYALQNPGRYVDPKGKYTLLDAMLSLHERGVYPEGYSGYSDAQIMDEWMDLEQSNNEWLNNLPLCPPTLPDSCSLDTEVWQEPYGGIETRLFHPGGHSQMRSVPTPGGHGNQCVYNGNGNLITVPPAAGSADYVSPNISKPDHYFHDVAPSFLANRLDRMNDYYDVRPELSE